MKWIHILFFSLGIFSLIIFIRCKIHEPVSTTVEDKELKVWKNVGFISLILCILFLTLGIIFININK